MFDTTNQTFPFIFGHRGAKNVHLENTIEAFKYACQSNIAGIELDAMLSKDGKVMVFHDNNLKRLAEKKVRLDALTYQELSEISLTGGFKIPTLEQVLDELKDYQGLLNIEIKPSRSKFARQTSQEICKLLKEKKFDNPNRVIFSSFTYDSLFEMMDLMPDIKRCVLVEFISTGWRKAAKKLNAYSINYDADLLKPKRIKEIKESGYKLFAYTVNDFDKALSLYNQGVNGFFCDNPVDIKEKFTKELISSEQ